jgi:hypothetical protein
MRISRKCAVTFDTAHISLQRLESNFSKQFSDICASKATHRSAPAQLDALFTSLQQRAFAGEL